MRRRGFCSVRRVRLVSRSKMTHLYIEVLCFLIATTAAVVTVHKSMKQCPTGTVCSLTRLYTTPIPILICCRSHCSRVLHK